MFAHRSASASVKCANNRVSMLLEQMSQSQRESHIQQAKKIKDKRRLYYSVSAGSSRKEQFSRRPNFRNTTRQGELLDPKPKAVPYVFIPGYKHQNFIMPDRVFETGKAGKRFFIKMKDTSVFSFRQPQDSKIVKAIRKDEKEKTIISRKIEEYDRVVDIGDGKKKAEATRLLFKTRKTFQPTNSFDVFSQYQPLMEPKEPETRQIKKVSLVKTYDYKKKWRPVTRGSQPFAASMSNSFYNQEQYPASII